MAPATACPTERRVPVAARPPADRDVRDMRIHMIGAGGAGMSALAAILLRQGACVSASDDRPSEQVERLARCGAQVIDAGRADVLPPRLDLVVSSAAIPEAHPQLAEARRRGVPTMRYAELLGWSMSRATGVAVSGTHGKTTTTAWLAFILDRAGLDPTFVVGGHVPQLGGSSRLGAGRHFVAEACEYDRSFLHLRPWAATILNIEIDHPDYFRDIDDVEQAFREFAARLPADGLLVIPGSDPRCRAAARGTPARVATVGEGAGDDWRAARIEASDGRYSFDLIHEGCTRARVELGIPGRHNVGNALSAAALAHHCGAGWDDLRRGLTEFRGVRRRMTLCGEAGGVRVIDDYAHHPTAVRVTLAAIREHYRPRRLWCVFQPHQHSRMRHLLGDFATCFDQADRLVVPDIYAARDAAHETQAVSARDLVQRVRDRGRSAEYIPEFEEIATRIARAAAPGDVVVTMGAGDIGSVADVLLERIRAHPHP